MEKDYSLLRPFDLEAAKRGEKIILMCGEPWPHNVKFCGASSNGKVVLIEFDDLSAGERYSHQLRMPPLAWVEGRPVYRGDTIYTTEGRAVVVNNTYREYAVTDGEWVVECRAATWQKPKTKREGWVNVYPNLGCVNIHKTKNEADACATFGDGNIYPNRVACIRVEWEE